MSPSEEEESYSGSSAVVEPPDYSGNLLPYIVSLWNEPGMRTRCLSVAVLLPSGIESGLFSVCVAEEGKTVDISYHWPNELVNILILHKNGCIVVMNMVR